MTVEGVIVCRDCSYEIIVTNTETNVDDDLIVHWQTNPTHVFELQYRKGA